jgi:hypothetical protein
LSVLYRNVHLNSPRQVFRFAKWVIENTTSSLINRVQEVHVSESGSSECFNIDKLSLDTTGPPESFSLDSCLETILSTLPNFSVINSRVTAPMVNCLDVIYTDVRRMTKISITVPAAIGKNLMGLNEAKKLQHLWVRVIGEDWDHESDSPDVTTTLELPTVMSMVFLTYECRDQVPRGMVYFIAGCRVAPNCSVGLDLELLSSEDAKSLSALFTHNTIKNLSIRAQPDAQSELAASIMSLPSVTIVGCPPSRSLLDHGLMPRKLSVACPYRQSYSSAPEFYHFLSSLEGFSKSSQEPSRLVIRYADTNEVDSYGRMPSTEEELEYLRMKIGDVDEQSGAQNIEIELKRKDDMHEDEDEDEDEDKDKDENEDEDEDLLK